MPSDVKWKKISRCLSLGEKTTIIQHFLKLTGIFVFFLFFPPVFGLCACLCACVRVLFCFLMLLFLSFFLSYLRCLLDGVVPSFSSLSSSFSLLFLLLSSSSLFFSRFDPTVLQFKEYPYRPSYWRFVFSFFFSLLSSPYSTIHIYIYINIYTYINVHTHVERMQGGCLVAFLVTFLLNCVSPIDSGHFYEIFHTSMCLLDQLSHDKMLLLMVIERERAGSFVFPLLSPCLRP